MEERNTVDNPKPPIAYNLRALIRCDATYLGAALPTETTQPPGIIHEPLAKICKKDRDASTPVNTGNRTVRLYIFHSGIVIEILYGKRIGELVWYPIQNLYCSAGLQPFKTKLGTIEFKTLEDSAGAKSSLKPIFAMVVRETVEKKVLQCHAFTVIRRELAQLLVQATSVAYKDKKGWNLPLNNEILGRHDYKYTLNIGDEAHLDSGYSDHEDSSHKSEQSPQSSELSVGETSKSFKDNHTGSHRRCSKHASRASSTSSASSSTITKDMLPSSPGSISQLSQKSPSSSAGFQSAESGRHSDDEQVSIQSGKLTSMSSGYPLSRDSSTTGVGHNRYHPPTLASPGHPPHRTYSRSSSHHGHELPDSFHSLSLNHPDINHNYRKTKTVPTIEIVEVDGVPRKVIHYQTHYEPTTPDIYPTYTRNRQYYNEPMYAPYHPEQFMYEGDHYLQNDLYSESDQSTQWRKEKRKPTKDSKRVSIHFIINSGMLKVLTNC